MDNNERYLQYCQRLEEYKPQLNQDINAEARYDIWLSHVFNKLERQPQTDASVPLHIPLMYWWSIGITVDTAIRWIYWHQQRMKSVH